MLGVVAEAQSHHHAPSDEKSDRIIHGMCAWRVNGSRGVYVLQRGIESTIRFHLVGARKREL